MKVAFDISSTESNHQFRGIGFYTERLHKNLEKINQKDSEFTLIPFSTKLPKADIYHFPAFSPFFFSFPLPLVTKSILTIHDLIPIEHPAHFPAGIRGNIKWQTQRLFLPFAKHIITDSNTSKSSIVKHTGVKKERISIIYLAADETFKPIKDGSELKKIKDKYELPEKFVLYVGDMNWNKNVLLLAQTCIDQDLPLVIVGKQAVANDIEVMHPWNIELVKFQMLAKEYPHLIKCLGFVKTNDLALLYNTATVLVHPALAEGFGLPVLEAMQSGCPVIVSNCSSLPEIVSDAGLTFSPKSKTELGKIMQKVWRDNILLKRLSEKGIKQAAKFSWEQVAWETISIYKKTYEN